MKEQIAKIKGNPVGTGVGAVGGYLIATKLLKTEKMWMTIAVAVVGGVVGAMVQANMKAKKGMPTASIVTATK
jgi:outer membrane lipoprotein SlyB